MICALAMAFGLACIPHPRAAFYCATFDTGGDTVLACLSEFDWRGRTYEHLVRAERV
jgi:hypothetical protein